MLLNEKLITVTEKKNKMIQPSEEKKMTPDEEKVLTAMKKIGKPVRPGDVAEATGIDSKEVSKIIASLKKQELIDSPKRCFYAPK